jgi:hypothetical protein
MPQLRWIWPLGVGLSIGVKAVEVVALRLGPLATVRVTLCFSLARSCRAETNPMQCVRLDNAVSGDCQSHRVALVDTQLLARHKQA